MAQSDPPPIPGDKPARAAGQDAALPAMQHEIGDALGFQQFGRPIERVTLADAAEVDLKLRIEEADRFVRLIEFQMPTADALEGRGKVFVARHLTGPAIKPPDLRQRAARDIV